MENLDLTTLKNINTADERERLEKALQASQERLQLALEVSDLAIWDWDMVRDELYLSPELLQMLDYAPGDIQNTVEAVRAIIHPDDAPRVFSALDEHLLHNTPYEVEHRMKTKSGEWRWMLVRGNVVERTADGKALRMVGVHRDIHETRMMQEQLLASEKRMRQQALALQSRNEELDAFAYTVAHDLKNPIAGMMGFASLIRNYYDRMDKEKIIENIDLILESAYKSKEIINALLLLAGVGKIEQPEMTPLNMYTILEDSQHRLSTLIEETGAVIHLPTDFPPAKGYAPWVEEVWVNYLSNALKYGGKPPMIEIGAEALANGMIRFWIGDNGGGLTKDEQERVFTPFTRLDQAKIEGHGLGLSVVQRIVQKLGGEVGVESAVGQGSIFSFTLPSSE